MPEGTLGHGVELLLLSQGPSREGTCGLCATSQKKDDGGMGKDFPWPWGLLRCLCMMEAAQIQLSVAASSPCSFASCCCWDPGKAPSGQALLGPPEKAVGRHRPQDLPVLLRSIHFSPGEQRQEQAAGQTCSEVLTDTQL